MPAYHQLQTYKILEADQKVVIEKYTQVLKNVGCWNGDIQKHFDNFSWKIEDNGFVYTGIQKEWQRFKINDVEFCAAPHVLGWTPQGNPKLKSNYLELGLLFQSADLEEDFPSQIVYRKGLEEGFLKIMFEFAKLFPDSGIYLTDEVQDGEPWDGLLENDERKLWNFDMALISENFIKYYRIAPETHSENNVSGFKLFKYKEKWPS